jgi:hypothetical protein
VAESYLQHADPDGNIDVGTGLIEVGNLISKIREANDLEFDIFFEGPTVQREYKLASINAEIKLLLEDFPSPAEFNEFQLSCANDTFFEVLVGNFRNSLVSFQTWLRKVEASKISAITKRLNFLKGHYDKNQAEIFELEQILGNFRDDDLASKIQNLKIFEHLHNERPSPLFLNLIRCGNNNDKLSHVKDDNGDSFASEKLRSKHIMEYYEKIYRKDANSENINYDNCIQNFLGQEIVNSDLVRGSILTAEEKNNLDQPLSVWELDKSLDSANMKSAPGQDGYSNLVIKKCWKYLRLPLLNYANHCFSTGILTPNFRSAVIKLIPKKGDVSQLKNWRPISLLSNLYKILSRAITARLGLINNRICSRAQKGYNKQRYVQEVLINVCETIRYCRYNGTRAGVIAVDMAKAFDTLNHKFIEQVYKFFGLGENIIKWLLLLGNQRQACITLENGSKLL